MDSEISDFLAGAVWSGNSNNGSFYGDATINLSGGRYAGGLQLDGNGDYVNAGNDSSLEMGTNDIIAFFDNGGNLKLKGSLGENYANP